MKTAIDDMTLFALEHSQNGLTSDCSKDYAESLAKGFRLALDIDEFIDKDVPVYIIMNALFRVAKNRLLGSLSK